LSGETAKENQMFRKTKYKQMNPQIPKSIKIKDKNIA